MKIIDNILNDYFSKILVKEIVEKIKMQYFLDIDIDIESNGIKSQTLIKIMVKPKHYKYYTEIFHFCIEDSFNHLINLKCAEENYIIKRIEELYKTDSWNKGR